MRSKNYFRRISGQCKGRENHCPAGASNIEGHRNRKYRSRVPYNYNEYWKGLERNSPELRKYKIWFHLMHAISLITFIAIIIGLFKFSGIASVGTVIWWLVVIFIIIGLIESVAYSHIFRKILNPLMALSDGLKKIAGGDYSVRISKESLDKKHIHRDMEELLDSFNYMVEELEEASKIKEEYEENRKLLLANISHDLKTPITTIQGYLEVLDEGIVTDSNKLNKYITVMNNNAKYMTKLIDDLFLYSKLDIDQVKFNFAKIDASSYFEDMMEEFQINYIEQGMEFNYSMNLPNSSEISIDSKMLRRALANIFNNAMKYGKTDEKVKVDVLITTDTDEKFITIKIKDYGLGIEEEKLPYIFNRFYSANDERTKDLESTGLGLAITKELITSQDGLIVAGNHKDAGAEFVIQLPIYKGEKYDG